MNAMQSDHEEYLYLSRKNSITPKPTAVERIILEGLICRYGQAHVGQMLNEMTVISCDEKDLIIHVDSDFDYDVLHSRLCDVIKTTVFRIYNIRPVISIVFTE